MANLILTRKTMAVKFTLELKMRIFNALLKKLFSKKLVHGSHVA